MRIAGARTAQQAKDNAQAANVQLSAEELQEMDRISKQVTDRLDDNPIMWDW